MSPPILSARLVVALALSFVLGCSCGEPTATSAPPTSAPAPTSATATAPSPTPATPPPPRSAVVPARAPHDAPAPEALARMRTELAEGRRLVHEGDDAAALPHFQAALEAVPTPRTRCETGYVAHRAGQSDAALTYVTQALAELPSDDEDVPESQRVVLAQCLYNAGLVFEAREAPSRALDAYRRSLALRPNATVQAAHDRLSAQVVAPPATGTLAALIDGHRAAWCASAEVESCPDACVESAESLDDDVSGCRTQHLVGPSVPGTPGFEVTLFEAYDFVLGELALVLGSGDQRTWLELASSTRPGAGTGSSSDFLVDDIAWRDVLPGGPSELVLRMHVGGLDHLWWETDAGAMCDEGGDDALDVTVVCADDGGTIRCATLLTGQRASTYTTCDPPDPDSPDVSTETSWQLDLRYENGRAIPTATDPLVATGEGAEAVRAAYQARLAPFDVLPWLREHACATSCEPYGP